MEEIHIQMGMLFFLGALIGYLIGFYKGGEFDRKLSEYIIAGKKVTIFVGESGVSYELDGNKIITTTVMLEQSEKEND